MVQKSYEKSWQLWNYISLYGQLQSKPLQKLRFVQNNYAISKMDPQIDSTFCFFHRFAVMSELEVVLPCNGNWFILI